MSSQLKLRGALKLAPEPFAAELAAWIEHGESPDDDMLAAILRNDLAAVIALSPQTSFGLPRAAMQWLWNFAPPGSYGSPAAVERWRQAHDTCPPPRIPLRRKAP